MIHSRDKRYEQLDKISWFNREILAKKSVIVVGAGTLGNAVLPHLALNGIGHILIVDMDTIEEHNLTGSPLYNENDIGKPKAVVAAQKLCVLNPRISVDYIVEDIQFVGLGHFKNADVMLGCVDSRLARMVINSKAWMTGKPYIDGGIDGETLTGRVKTFMPPKGPCLTCSWYPEDWRLVERRYPCSVEVQQSSAPTMSTQAAVIGGIIVNETLKILLGMQERTRPGRELRWDLMNHVFLETQLLRNSACTLDHDFIIGETILLPKTVAKTTMKELFDILSEHLKGNVTIDFHRELVTSLICDLCGTRREVLIAGKIPVDKVHCSCSGRFQPSSFIHTLNTESGEPYFEMNLGDIGIPHAEIISATDNKSNELFFEFPGAFMKEDTQ